MTTRGSGVTLTSDKRETLTCARCLDIFRDPKLLPCAHTFCQKCLEDLIQQHPGGTIPCPACGEDIEVPAQGASEFQTNICTDEEALEGARDDTLCSVHRNKLEMFCVDCDFLICVDCKQGGHLHHRSQLLQDSEKDAEDQLSIDRVRLRKMKEDIEKKVAEWRIDYEEFKGKKSVVESKIRHRHAILVAEADKYLKEALESLQEACSETENTLSIEVQNATDNIQRLLHLQHKIAATVENRELCKMVKLAAEVRAGCGSPENVKKMEMKPLQHISRPVHMADIPADDAMFVSMKNFIGTAELRTCNSTHPEVKVKEEVECGEHADSVVFCVGPGDNTVCVSFEPSYKDHQPCVKKFSAEDKLVTVMQNEGPHSCRHREADRFIVIPHAGEQHRKTYVKCSTSDKHHRLITDVDRKKGDVMLVTVATEEPFTATKTALFAIECGPHRAVDVDSTGELYAVVEDATTRTPGGSTRQVKLFQRSKRNAVDTYLSPVMPCTPADVCFFALDGEEVLLIADEMNDAIHVVKVKDKRLTFSRFLAPGCPVLVQPTALNKDPRGRLWVGCRGGRLLTMEPVAGGAPLRVKPRTAAAAVALESGGKKKSQLSR